MTRRRLCYALAAYALLAALSIAFLKGPFQWAMLIYFAGLAVKSWVIYKREQL